MNKSVNFQDIPFKIYTVNDKIHFSASDIAKAFFYQDSSYIIRIVEKNKDKLTPDMTFLVKEAMGRARKIRVFSIQGLMSLCELINNKQSEQLTEWALYLLENVDKIENQEDVFLSELDELNELGLKMSKNTQYLLEQAIKNAAGIHIVQPLQRLDKMLKGIRRHLQNNSKQIRQAIGEEI